jgi:lambda repressor-like predicted transcriptional regulator
MHHRNKMRAELILVGSSLATIARDLNLAYPTVYGVVSGQRSKRVEAHIAHVLGKTVEEIWPDRYPGHS